MLKNILCLGKFLFFPIHLIKQFLLQFIIKYMTTKICLIHTVEL